MFLAFGAGIKFPPRGYSGHETEFNPLGYFDSVAPKSCDERRCKQGRSCLSARLARDQGYDAVAYYQQSAPVKGSSQFRYQWRGATWLFANAENRELFQADPERYAPQYGGYRAYAVSKGHTASIDPEAWKIVDGRLYLNYSKGVQKKWAEDVPGNIVNADRNWPDLHR